MTENDAITKIGPLRRNIDYVIYPPKIAEILGKLVHHGSRPAGCVGTEANFSCGCVVRIRLDIDPASRTIVNARFASNGCGWMVASAEIVSEFLAGKALGDLHGLSDDDILAGLGSIEIEWSTCVLASVAAAKAAFADYRSRQIEEFRGEKALICTCFGVTDERIETAIIKFRMTTVQEVGAKTNAGTGCGSCRMLIQEILDGR